jgi:hypothetical protein
MCGFKDMLAFNEESKRHNIMNRASLLSSEIVCFRFLLNCSLPLYGQAIRGGGNKIRVRSKKTPRFAFVEDKCLSRVAVVGFCGHVPSIADLLAAAATASHATEFMGIQDNSDQEAFNVALEALRSEAALFRCCKHSAEHQCSIHNGEGQQRFEAW